MSDPSSQPPLYVITLHKGLDLPTTAARLMRDYGLTDVHARGRTPHFSARVPDRETLMQDASVLGARLKPVPPYRYMITLCQGVDKTEAIRRMTAAYGLTEVAGEEWDLPMFSTMVPEAKIWPLASDRSVRNTRMVGLESS